MQEGSGQGTRLEGHRNGRHNGRLCLDRMQQHRFLEKGAFLLRGLQGESVPGAKKEEVNMHPPFLEEVVFFVTGSYVPWLPEGWPVLVIWAWFFYMFLVSDKMAKEYTNAYHEHMREIARKEMNEQQRRRRQR